MNATITKPFSVNGATVRPGLTGRIDHSVGTIGEPELDIHVVDLPGFGLVMVPVDHCRLHAQATLPDSLTPEQQITNVLDTLNKLISTRTYPGRMMAVIETVYQLRQMWGRYLVGELPFIVDDVEVPF